MISYNVDDYGTLKIYIDEFIHAEISDCGNISEEEIKNLIDEVAEEREG